MSFVDQEEVIKLTNNLMKEIFNSVNLDFPKEIPIITYQEAMEKFSSDKPDCRFELPLKTANSLFKESQFKVFQSIIQEGGLIKGLKLPKGTEHLSRKKIDALLESISMFDIKGISWIHHKENNEIQSPLSKFLTEKEIKDCLSTFETETGDSILLIGHINPAQTHDAAAKLRVECAKLLNLIKGNYSLLWVVDFPLFETSKSTGEITPIHHPFTSPNHDDINKLESHPLQVRSVAYDIVLNGFEIEEEASEYMRKPFKIKFLKFSRCLMKIFKINLGFS